MLNGKITLKSFLDSAIAGLSSHYEPEELNSILMELVKHILGWNKAEARLREGESLNGEALEKFREAISALTIHRPIQYIIGEVPFRQARIHVGPGVLIPRPETEELAALAALENRQRQYQEFSILDVGTGSGCLAVSMKMAFPYARVEAVDISAEALSVARTNALTNKTEIMFRQMDILDRNSWTTLPGFHMIISNPPYVTVSEKEGMKPNVLDHEPHTALFVPDTDPLVFYRAITGFAARHLLRPGVVYLEINERFGREVRSLMESAGFDRTTVIRDLRGKDRFVRAEAGHDMADTSYWMADKDLP